MISSPKVSDGLDVPSKNDLQKLKRTGRTFQHQRDTSFQTLVAGVDHLCHKLLLYLITPSERVTFTEEVSVNLVVTMVEGVVGLGVSGAEEIGSNCGGVLMETNAQLPEK